MKKLVIALSLALVISGCGQSTPAEVGTGRKETAIEVKKSPENNEVFVVNPDTDLKKAMDSAAIPYSVQTRGTQEVITQLSGVIVTTGKAWKLYVDNELKNFTKLSDITLEKGTKISWRYEAI